jgi:bacillithiol biosynthesis cysteine-adding enzyme BshC
VALGLLPPLAAAFLAGRDRDLLAPLEFLVPGALPLARASAVDRAPLAAGLAEANSSYGHPAAELLAAKLARPETAVVVTGQQPGLFGGPLYTLTKAVAAARWAEALEAAGRPAVAVFWIATEDHDFRESSWASFNTAEGVRRFDLGADPHPLMPLGMRSLGPTVATILGQLRDAVPGDRFAAWCDTLARWYRPTARFGEAFARLLAHLLGERCPLLLDSMLPAVKTAERPWLARTVERRAAVDEALTAASATLAESGYPLQVTPQPGASPLFFLHGGERRRIVWEGEDAWSLRGLDATPRPVAELLAAVADNPSVVMPGVLVRPVIQDAILGSTLQVMGPGEMSYLPQLAPLYDILEVPPPATALRPQALLWPEHQDKKLERAEVTLETLVAEDFDLDRATLGAASKGLLAPARAHLTELLGALEGAAAPVAQEVEQALVKTGDQMRRALEQFDGRLTAALGRADEVRRNRLAGLSQWVRPEGELQERALATADLPGRYGGDVVDALFEQLELDGGRLHVVRIV